MIQSIIVYSLMCSVLYFATKSSYVYVHNDGFGIKQRRSNIVGLFFALFVFAFFSGVRWDVGIDHLGYVNDYKTVGIIGDVYREDMEIGYVYLMKIFNSCGLHYTVFLGVIAFLQLFFVYYAFKNQKYIIPFLGVFIMCGGDFFFWMNGIRQALVATFFVCLLIYLVINKRLIAYLICILIASYIHKSALLLIIFYPIAYLSLDKFYLRREIQYIIFVSALLLSTTNIWTYLLDFVDSIFSFIGYDERFKMSRIEDNIREQNFGVRKLIFLIIDSIIIYYSFQLRSIFRDKIFGLIYLFYFALIILQPLLVSSIVFNRMTGYFYVFRAIVSAYLLFYLFEINKTKINRNIGVLIFILYYLHLFIQIYSDKGNHTDCVCYNFFWDFN